jgi:DHA3 family macrolide efflux protein-like MFS transporter
MIVGGAVLSILGGFPNKVKTTGLGIILLGLGTVALGLLTNFPLYTATMGLVGIAAPITSTPVTSLLQAKVDPAHMGRVFSFYVMASTIATPVSMIIFGPLSDAIAIDILLIVTGIACLAEVVVIAFDKIVVNAGK